MKQPSPISYRPTPDELTMLANAQSILARQSGEPLTKSEVIRRCIADFVARNSNPVWPVAAE